MESFVRAYQERKDADVCWWSYFFWLGNQTFRLSAFEIMTEVIPGDTPITMCFNSVSTGLLLTGGH